MGSLPVIVFIFLVMALEVCLAEPIVFDNNIESCTYSKKIKKKHVEVDMSGEVWTINYPQMKIHYKFCSRFGRGDVCPQGSVACVHDNKTEVHKILGTEFILNKDSKLNIWSDVWEMKINEFKSTILHIRANNPNLLYYMNNVLPKKVDEQRDVAKSLKLLSLNGEACRSSQNYSVSISFECNEDASPDPTFMFYNEEDCTYHITMRNPKCLPKCATKIGGKFIDLRPLTKSFFITTPDRNFSITLCDVDETCDEDDVNACEIKGTEVVPISLDTTFSLSYNGDTNQFLFHGNTYRPDGNKMDKRFELILKCNWEKDIISNDDLRYIKKQPQGKKYTFELETSYGCVKNPVPCIVNDKFLIYNLSGLYSEHQGPWSVNSGDSNFFLQLCGPVKLSGRNSSCKSPYAQVCENNNGVVTNRGSVLRHLDVVDDVLKARVESGMQCLLHNEQQYKTFIDFYCDAHEQGPKFERQEDCDTHFTWKTRHACPQYNISSCSHVHLHYENCSFFQNNISYNLNVLTLNQKSIKIGRKEFLINICGPVIDSDAPCMKDVSVAVKKLDELNKKHRVVSLGKLAGSSIKKGNLVLEYNTGYYCDKTDYKSEIHFECSNSEEDPIVVKQDKCFFEFLWKTRYGCPELILPCTFVDESQNKSVDLSRLSYPRINLDSGQFKYTFDICQKQFTNCTKRDDCRNESVKNHTVRIEDNLASIVFTLPNDCVASNDFNVVNFTFVCDQFKNNDHVQSMTIVNCVINMNYATSLICSDKDTLNYTPKKVRTANTNISSSISNPSQLIPSLRIVDECHIKSPFTKTELNLTELHIINNITSYNECPAATFNNTYRFVKLFYMTNKKCHLSSGKNVSYELFLKCTSQSLLPSMSGPCLEHYNFEKTEYCKFFSSMQALSSATVGGIVGIVLLIVAILTVALIVCIKKRIICFKSTNSGFISIYEKENILVEF